MSRTQSSKPLLAVDHDRIFRAALDELRNSPRPERGIPAQFARKYHAEIRELKESGWTYADICAAIKKNGGPEIGPNQLGNAVVKLERQQVRVTDGVGTGKRAPAKKAAKAR